MVARYDRAELNALAERLLSCVGMDRDKATVVATKLVEADLLGHDTHGLQLLAGYMAELRTGRMRGSGTPRTVSDHGPVTVWDGDWICGVWLATAGLDLACEKATEFGVGVVSIKRSHHIACLQTYLPSAVERGLVPMIVCTDPSAATVAPFGGLDPVLQPDPMAIGFPTGGDPILIDMSASITTNGMVQRKRRAGSRLEGLWLQDSDGNLSDDPTVLDTQPPGTLLLSGGHDHGHKGYGMALLVECLAQGLSGYGRANSEKRWSSSVFIEVLDPRKFAGLGEFEMQAGHLVTACHGSRAHPRVTSVRTPGEAAMRRKARGLVQGRAGL